MKARRVPSVQAKMMIESFGAERAKRLADEAAARSRYQTDVAWWEEVSRQIAPPPPPPVLTPMEKLERYMSHQSYQYRVVHGENPHVEIYPDQPAFR